MKVWLAVLLLMRVWFTMELVTKCGCLYIQDIRPQVVLQKHARWKDTEPTAADITKSGFLFWN